MKSSASILRHLVPLYVAAMAYATLGASPALAIDKGEAYPELAFKHAEKGELSAEALKGKVTIINFWATWCAACKVELVEMAEQFKALTSEPDFHAAFVSLDSEPVKAKEWLDERAAKTEMVRRNLYVDPKFEGAERLGIDAFPMTLIIDRNGRVAYVQKGFETGQRSTEAMVELAKKLLAAKP